MPTVLSFSTSRNQSVFRFSFIFLIFFLTQEHKNRNTTKYQLQPMKDVISINSGVFGKNDAETSQLESRVFLFFLIFFEISKCGEGMESYVQFFESFPRKKVHLNRSSERKVMPDLWRTLRSRCWRWQN